MPEAPSACYTEPARAPQTQRGAEGLRSLKVRELQRPDSSGKFVNAAARFGQTRPRRPPCRTALPERLRRRKILVGNDSIHVIVLPVNRPGFCIAYICIYTMLYIVICMEIILNFFTLYIYIHMFLHCIYTYTLIFMHINIMLSMLYIMLHTI